MFNTQVRVDGKFKLEKNNIFANKIVSYVIVIFLCSTHAHQLNTYDIPSYFFTKREKVDFTELKFHWW